jgi:uncharacterized protein
VGRLSKLKQEEIKEAMEFYRKLATTEMKLEKVIDHKLVGPRELIDKNNVDFTDIILTERPYLSKDSSQDVDMTYVTTFRMGNLKKPGMLTKTGYGTDMVGGIEFGSNLVKEGLIKSLDDIVKFLIKYKIGILDVFAEEDTEYGKKLDLRVYECIDCAGLPNIGIPICYFETGLIIGLLSELTRKQVEAVEVRCWTSGFSFCHFEVEIID